MFHGAKINVISDHGQLNGSFQRIFCSGNLPAEFFLFSQHDRIEMNLDLSIVIGISEHFHTYLIDIPHNNRNGVALLRACDQRKHLLHICNFCFLRSIFRTLRQIFITGAGDTLRTKTADFLHIFRFFCHIFSPYIIIYG